MPAYRLVEPGVTAGERHQAIQRTTVEQMPNRARRANNRLIVPFPSPRAHRRRRPARSSASRDLDSTIDKPIALARAAKPGNEVATLATSSIAIAAAARSDATAKDIAMR
jgi:hypothetical protein